MLTIQKLFLAAATTAATLAAQSPTIYSVVNSAGGGLASFGIAQGSLMVIYGDGIGASGLHVASTPFPTDQGLLGTMITLTVQGTTVTAPIYYTSPAQVGAVVPSGTPIGSGTLTLNYNGRSDSYPISVRPTSFGIFSSPNERDSSGYLTNAGVTFLNYQYVSTANTAKPGDTLVIWGSGLGATPKNGGDTGAAPAGNIGNAPLVFVGGVQSPSVAYWGRSPGSVPGLDQINFVVPQNAPLGCNVSVVVQTDAPAAASNAPTIALAASDGAPCSDSTQILPASVFNRSGMKALFSAVGQTVGTNFNPDGTLMATYATAGAQVRFFQFTQANPGQVSEDANIVPTLGTCYSTFAIAGGDVGIPATYLNAGISLTLTPPSGMALTLPYQYSPGYYAARSNSLLPGGTYDLSDGAGGSDVGAFNFSFPVPQPITWTNQAAVLSGPIVRTNPLTITWSGGDPNSYVEISGVFGDAFAFRCAAPSVAGQFSIPPSILLGFAPEARMILQISTIAFPFTLGNVAGVDVAINQSIYINQYALLFFK